MSVLINDRVDAYLNLRTGGFSVRKRGKVVLRCNALIIRNPKFIVSSKGRERVLRDKCKNVHAFIRGNFVVAGNKFENFMNNEAYYNPYMTETFINKVTGEPLHEAMYALLIDGKTYYISKDDVK